ncbi:MAG: rRNA pseudouridine synthase [Bifidobacteriaceae bacterium]|jgi:23S rRNA pseudouridine2605 synthase|nr:rRNA pseudouridine synthase [Bifidobacteriaceae bacterium]
MDKRTTVRLQKALSFAGIASRRAAEKMVDQARVEVNGQIVSEQGRQVDIVKDDIKVDGIKVNFNKNRVTLALNKPLGVESTMSLDVSGTSLADLIDNKYKGVFPIGRLDKDTSGLLLFTNDGELAYKLSHPKYKIAKIYMCLVNGLLTSKYVDQLELGVEIEIDEKKFISKFDKVKIIGKNADKTILQITLHSGKNRIIRRTISAIGFEIIELSRIQFGTIKLEQLKSGKTRVLSAAEVRSLEKNRLYNNKNNK